MRLSSAHDINLESVQDSYKNRTDSKNSGWNAGVFVGYNGGSYGFGFEASGQVGKGRENTDSLQQRNTYLNANQLELESQNDTNLRGAVVKAERLDANIGHDLNIESRQDSQTYDSKQTQAGGSVSVAWGSGGSASANFSLNKAKMNYAQVEEQSGLQVGKDGMNVNVANNTHLAGGLIASQAEAEKNHFSTNTLTSENIKNHSEVSVQSVSGGFSTSGVDPMSLAATAISTMGNTHKSDSSTTHSAVGANIQLDVKKPQKSPTLSSLSRDTENANEKVQRFDVAEIKEQQEAAQVVGELAARIVGDVSQKLHLEEGSKEKIALHAFAGFLAAKAGDGNALAGAAAGAASEWLNTQVADYLSQHKELTEDERKAIQQASALGIGAIAGALTGGGTEAIKQGAVTSFNAEKFNRQLHPDEVQRIKELAKGDEEKEFRLTAAACALVHCSAQIPDDEPDYAESYAKAKALEDIGNRAELSNERELLSRQLADIDFTDAFGSGRGRRLFEYNSTQEKLDAFDKWDTKYGVSTRASGAIRTVEGGAVIAGSIAGTGAVCAGTGGLGCGLATVGGTVGATYGYDQFQAGYRTLINGKQANTFGADLLSQVTGMSPTMANLIYDTPAAFMGGSGTVVGGGRLASAGARAGNQLLEAMSNQTQKMFLSMDDLTYRLPNALPTNPYIDLKDLDRILPPNYSLVSWTNISGPQGGKYYLVGRKLDGTPIYANNQRLYTFTDKAKTELKPEPKITVKNNQQGWLDGYRNTSNPQGFIGENKLYPNNIHLTQSTTWQAPQKGTGLEYRVYQQEIDLNLRPFVDKGSLKTNEELMKKGYAPYVVKDGKYEQLQLHHSRQDGRGALFELTKETHLYKTDQTGRKALHPYGNNNSHPEFPVERSLFDIDRPQYWQDRLNKLKGN